MFNIEKGPGRKMKKEKKGLSAEFRYGVVSQLFCSPPEAGALQEALRELAAKEWKHPKTAEPFKIHFKTIERWYYLSKKTDDSVGNLKRKQRNDVGKIVLSHECETFLRKQYSEHKSWTMQLHARNVAAAIKQNLLVAKCPSYSTVRRFMLSNGLLRIRRCRNASRETYQAVMEQQASREIRSYEVTHIGSLYHTDFHHGRIKVVGRDGNLITPNVCAIIDDKSRLVVHAQWYESETTEVAVHTLIQAFQKRGLPRALMTDNGAAFVAAEYVNGLAKYGVTHQRTLEYSPHQNGKQERFWGCLEGQLISMLENECAITLKELNDYTQAWVEMDYNKALHSEIKKTPIESFMNEQSILRVAPPVAEIKKAFMVTQSRKQRRTDGTVSIDGVRFEVPQAYRHFTDLVVRYARFDLSKVYLCCKESGDTLTALRPLDRAANSDGFRKSTATQSVARPNLPPLMKQIMADAAKENMPSQYIPK